MRDALNSGTAGTEDEVETPAADDAIAKAAERVQAETNGKVPVINPNSMAALGIEVVDVRIGRSTCRRKCLRRSTTVCAPSVKR